MTLPTASWPLAWIVAGFNLLLAGAQLLFFAPPVAGGRSLDFPPFRADALGVTFGVTWTLALALALPALDPRSGSLSVKLAAYLFLFSPGLLTLAYAREPLLFLAGWEITGLALWLSLREMNWPWNVSRLALSIHLPGLLLLPAILLGPIGPFVPPQGGEAAPWPLFVSLLLGVVALLRVSFYLFLGRPDSGDSGLPLISLYILVSPFVLAKALVAAPWGDLGAWSLALLGTVALLASLLALLLAPSRPLSIAAGCAFAAIIGLGLASLSPLAALGAVALLLACTLWIAAQSLPYQAALLLLAAFPGLWFMSQGALDMRYRLIAAILLPALFLFAYQVKPEIKAGRLRALQKLPPVLATCLLILYAIYPQVPVEWVLRPAISAMAGGVGVPGTLSTNWGLGLVIKTPQEIVLASLPATGVALAIFLAWVALYWLRALARLLAGGEQQTKNQHNAAQGPTGDGAPG